MKNNEYPTWLVPLDIAQELKKIGFNEPCLYYNSEAISGMGYQCIEIEERIHNEDPNVIELRELKYFNYNKTKGCTSIPTWEQAFEWFRKNGLFHNIAMGRDSMEEDVDFQSYVCKEDARIVALLSQQNTYEEAREALLNKLIEVYKKLNNK